MTSIFDEALSTVDSSVRGVLELAYDPDRFKQYARETLPFMKSLAVATGKKSPE